ncbi:MAG: DUF3592 domain-containing protein [Chthoniobacter sp.]|uniref:DUF3592 domain-containing protein n=1 Tax=Chthoniobacter sp. TaxID=2510640 RepID=UPI0032A79780
MSSLFQQPAAARESNASQTAFFRVGLTVLFLIGAGFFLALTAWPGFQILNARPWPATPCTVDSSQVFCEQGDDSTSYRVDIHYHYTFGGQSHTSGRYCFGAGFPNGLRTKQAIVNRHPAGLETTCFVNPRSPDQAVLNRGWQPEMGRGIFAFFLALAGGLGLIFSPALARWKSETEAARTVATGTGGPILLTPQRPPTGKFLTRLIATLAFNSVIGFIAYLLFFVEDRRDVELGPRIILCLFLFAGFLFLCNVVEQFCSLFRPRVMVTVQNTSIPVGGELRLSWTVTGKVSRLQKVHLTLEGRNAEETRGGRKVRTKKQVFAKINVFDASNREFPAQGAAHVVVPLESRPSVADEQFWSLRVRGKTRGLPDIDDEYPINIVAR